MIRVTFYEGEAELAAVINPPYAFTWTEVDVGRYDLRVEAQDDFGSVGVSTARTVHVEGRAVGELVVRKPPASTRERSILLGGRGPRGADIVVVNDAVRVAQAVDGDGRFAVPISLRINKLNRLFVSAERRGARMGPPIALQVIQDEQPPSLFIDFPEHGAELTRSSVVLAGRVGDLLSGFLGLDVHVDRQPANVIVGIGPNGTFERSAIPLAMGRNTFQVTASDRLGNSTSKQITLHRVPIRGPQMDIVSGNIQTGTVHTRLPEPVVVRVTHANGDPFPNKVVTFGVLRSDGRLSAEPDPETDPSPMLQVFTDANGLARAYWRMGADAGCGNNRLGVTSKDIAGTIFFCASAYPRQASQINIGAGNNQRTESGGPAPEPLKVWVNDTCNGVSSVPVTFRVRQGGGKVNGRDEVTVESSLTGHAQVDFVLGPRAGNHVVEATFPDNPHEAATFVLVGLETKPGQPTQFSGLVLDNAGGPIGRARCSLTVEGERLEPIWTGEDGQFLFADVPAGSGHLHVDGLPATTLRGAPVSEGTFPALSYEVLVVPHTENSLPAPVLFPRLNPANVRSYDGTQDVILTVEGMAGLKMIVKAGSMRRADGTVPGPGDAALLSLNQVHHDDIPMPMPDGAAPPFAWTLQPAGATFHPPIRIEYPNMSGLPPGAIAYFLSFDHDMEQFVIVATGHVTHDGACIVTDPGVGLTKAGWGCNCPPYAVAGECLSECDTDCDGQPDSDFVCGDSCYACDTNQDGCLDSCTICDNDGDGENDACHTCDTNGDGVPDDCNICDNDDDGTRDSCYTCDSDGDGTPDGCHVCDSDGDGRRDACFTCDTDGDDKPDDCFVCDDDGDGARDACYQCDSDGNGDPDSCHQCDTDADGVRDACYLWRYRWRWHLRRLLRLRYRWGWEQGQLCHLRPRWRRGQRVLLHLRYGWRRGARFLLLVRYRRRRQSGRLLCLRSRWRWYEGKLSYLRSRWGWLQRILFHNR